MVNERLDNEELLRLALAAMNAGDDADALVLLKALLERDPGHLQARYLLAAQHAQLGMYERAEAGLRSVLDEAPDMAMARFQLGQLLAMKADAGAEAVDILRPLVDAEGALAAYARALQAAVSGDVAQAIEELERGLAFPQEVAVLASDMRRLLEQLRHAGGGDPAIAGAPQATPMFLTGYGRGV